MAFITGAIIGLTIGVVIMSAVALAINESWATKCREINNRWYNTAMMIIHRKLDKDKDNTNE